jgi:acetolactate synthase-1/2/3 large subunit
MGYGFPSAVGAQAGRPDMPVVAITGDGSFQMCIQELATVRQYNLPLKIFIINNGCLGMVRQWQQLFFDRRYSQTCFEFNPDFSAIAEGYGIRAEVVTEADQVQPTIEKALAADGPMLVDFIVEMEENVLPMIPAGGGQTDFVPEDKA